MHKQSQKPQQVGRTNGQNHRNPKNQQNKSAKFRNPTHRRGRPNSAADLGGGGWMWDDPLFWSKFDNHCCPSKTNKTGVPALAFLHCVRTAHWSDSFSETTLKTTHHWRSTLLRGKNNKLRHTQQVCGLQKKISYFSHRGHAARAQRTEPRFRAIECYDDPTVAVVVDPTREDRLSLKPGNAVGECHACRPPSVHQA